MMQLFVASRQKLRVRNIATKGGRDSNRPSGKPISNFPRGNDAGYIVPEKCVSIVGALVPVRRGSLKIAQLQAGPL